jgi:hypothetical protein
LEIAESSPSPSKAKKQVTFGVGQRKSAFIARIDDEDAGANSEEEQENQPVSINAIDSQNISMSGILAGEIDIDDGAPIPSMAANRLRKGKSGVLTGKSRVITARTTQRETGFNSKSNTVRTVVRQQTVSHVQEEEENPVEEELPVQVSAEERTPSVSNTMVAVGYDIHGKKCFFRLVPMTEQEVAEVRGLCLPYSLTPPSLSRNFLQ